MCGRDGFGVLGFLGVNGFAAGLSTNFFALPALSDGGDNSVADEPLLVFESDDVD